MHDRLIICVPASRLALLLRAVFRAVPAAILWAAVVGIARGLDFSPAASTSRLVEYSWAIALIPLAVAAGALTIGALRYGVMAVWPGFVGVEATDDALLLRRGPWGSRRFDAVRLDVRYLFEMDEDEHGGLFEAFIPQEDQRASFVPPLRHPDSREPLQRAILRLTAREERDTAARLRPALDRWRAMYHPELDEDE